MDSALKVATQWLPWRRESNRAASRQLHRVNAGLSSKSVKSEAWHRNPGRLWIRSA